jgi:hypothetical protein
VTPVVPPASAPSPRNFLSRLMLAEAHSPSHEGPHVNTHEKTYPWWMVLWLTGMDYFSTLGYQPGIAFLAAGELSPVATAVLVVVTLFGALPIYAQVAKRSYAGQGSISMLETLLPGWFGKLFVLALLGFASTDFVITMTLSAADAAQHAVENPLLHHAVGDAKMTVTLVLLAMLAAVFLRGFEEAIGLAAVVGVPYILLNGVVMVKGISVLAQEPSHLGHWKASLAVHGSWPALLFASSLIFPKLALGMSGFETGVSVMPLIHGEEKSEGPPTARIRATHKLLVTAAGLMAVMLVASSLVTTLLIPEALFKPGGAASGRALAYLAHQLLGDGFGTIYDVSTIAILWFAGASAMAGLLNLIPRYLPRFGMAPTWVVYKRPLIVLLFGIDVIVTWVFKADVDAQGGAYATGVLVLMTSAAVAVALSLWTERRRGASAYFWFLTAVFAYTLVDNVIVRPDGVIIASIFIFVIMVLSAISRYRRATELRVEKLTFVDAETEALWNSFKDKKVNLVPQAHDAVESRTRNAQQVRTLYRVEGPLCFAHVTLAKDTSEFQSELRVRISREGEAFVMEIDGAVAIANAIAFVSEQLDPIAIFLRLTRRNAVAQALKFLLWGEGETGIMVYEILVNYWDATPEDDVRPMIFLMST